VPVRNDAETDSSDDDDALPKAMQEQLANIRRKNTQGRTNANRAAETDKSINKLRANDKAAQAKLKAYNIKEKERKARNKASGKKRPRRTAEQVARDRLILSEAGVE